MILIAIARAHRGEQFEIDVFVQELDRSVGKQTVRTLRMQTANVVLELRCTVDRKGLIEKIPSIDPLPIGEVGVFGNSQCPATYHR